MVFRSLTLCKRPQKCGGEICFSKKLWWSYKTNTQNLLSLCWFNELKKKQEQKTFSFLKRLIWSPGSKIQCLKVRQILILSTSEWNMLGWRKQANNFSEVSMKEQNFFENRRKRKKTPDFGYVSRGWRSQRRHFRSDSERTFLIWWTLFGSGAGVSGLDWQRWKLK